MEQDMEAERAAVPAHAVRLSGLARWATPATGPALGTVAVVALLGLAAMVAATGLGRGGVLAGVAYTAGLCGLLAGAQRRAGRAALGPADLVTVARALLVGGVTAVVVDRLLGGVTTIALLVVLAAVALALDAADGQVARRTGTASAVGARFDMEVDAFLILVLSVSVALDRAMGPWVLAIGGMRYAFVVAGRMLPWLRGSLPPRLSAKAVAALQGVVLVVAHVVEGPAAVGLVAVALAALCWSFGRDVPLLWAAAEPDAPTCRTSHMTSRRVAARGPDRRRDADGCRLGRARPGDAALRDEVAR